MNADQFLNAYIALMAKVSLRQHNMLWWATDMASKNRFANRLPQRLQDKIEGKAVDLSPLEPFTFFVRRLLSMLRHATRSLSRAAIARRELAQYVNDHVKANQTYYIVKTGLYKSGINDQGAYTDAFFGPLTATIAKQRPTIVIVDIFDDFNACIEKIKTSKDVVIIPWEYFLKPADVIGLIFKAIGHYPKPLEGLSFLGHDVTAIVNHELKSKGAWIQPYQLFQYSAICNLGKTIQFDRFLHTYEGNPWERMCHFAIRKVQPKAQIIGYQHNVVPQASLNMFITPEEIGHTPLPDKILTPGKEPKDIMEDYGAYPDGLIDIACALRMGHLFSQKSDGINGVKRLLVVLEGVDDVHHMIRYVIDQLKDHPEMSVVFRTHPVMPWAYYETTYEVSIHGIAHMSLSQGKSLTDDIMQADVIMYWGTTVAMEALSFGKPIIHFDNGFVLSYDPLFRCKRFKWVVTHKSSLPDTLKTIASMSPSEANLHRNEAFTYLKSYFYPISDPALAKFLK